MTSDDARHDSDSWKRAFDAAPSGKARTLGDQLAPLLRAILDHTGAERAFVLTERDDGRVRILTSRHVDDRAVPEAEAAISPFALTRAQEQPRGVVFDTRHDRRFRTEAELKSNARTQSIAVCALPTEHGVPRLYLDSRFRAIELDPNDPHFRAATRILVLTLELETWKRQSKQLERRVEAQNDATQVEATGADERSEASRTAESPRRSETAPRPPTERTVDFHGFVTRHPALVRTIEDVGRVATEELSVFIEGESGVGKEVLARAIHERSGRQGRFVSLHCGSLPESLVEVELFGHSEGAFTGANEARTGLIEAARGGTLFLDAIGDMSEALQNALLRVLETRRYRPVRAVEEETADIRVIASALIGPDGERSADRIRRDLFFRLAGLHVVIPPLRERTEDISLLVDRLAARHLKPEETFSVDSAVEQGWGGYAWPGNVRELQNAIRRATALGRQTLSLEDFPQWLGTAGDERKDSGGRDMRSVVGRTERELLLEALEECGGNKSKAAQILGLSRKTLYRRLHKHGIAL